MDGPRDHVASEGRWTAEVVDGRLSVEGAGRRRDLGPGVLPELAWSGDQLVFPQGETADSDLLLVTLPDGLPERLTDWEGYEDRPAFSPDGTRLAFFAGRSGLPSLYVMDLGTRAVTQLTNAGVAPRAPRPGVAPEGFVPPPEEGPAAWSDAHTLTWVAGGRTLTVAAP